MREEHAVNQAQCEQETGNRRQVTGDTGFVDGVSSWKGGRMLRRKKGDQNLPSIECLILSNSS
jgi:hypothetical protein